MSGFSKRASKGNQTTTQREDYTPQLRPLPKIVNKLFTPTKEQDYAEELFMSKKYGIVKIGASAGSGKSTTLYHLGKQDTRPSLGLVFGKDMAEEARAKSPSHIDWRSTHSLAYGKFGAKYQHKLKRPHGRYVNVAGTGAEIGRYLGLKPTMPFFGGHINVAFLGLIVKETVGKFETSVDEEVSRKHLPYNHIKDLEKKNGRMFNKDKFKVFIRDAAKELWELRKNLSSNVLITHNTYLKLYHLSNPDLSLDYSVIYLDEAQDLNPVTLDLIVKQQGKCKIILVGDSYQNIYCQPKGTKVTKVVYKGSNGRDSYPVKVPIESLAEGDRVLSYSIEKRHLHKSGKPITKIGSKMYEGTLVSVECGESKTTYTKDHLCLARIDPTYKNHTVVYLMQKKGKFRIGSCKMAYGTAEDFATGVCGFVARSRTEAAEKSWVLSVHKEEKHARLEEYLLSARFGVPQVCYQDPAGQSKNEVSAYVYKNFWKNVDPEVNYFRGREIISEFELDYANPLWTNSKHKNFTQRSNPKLRQVFEVSAANLFEGVMMVEDTGDLPAKGFSNKNWKNVSFTKYHSRCEVFSMDVADNHNYFGDGILTHNCFNGAVNGMKEISCPEAALTKSFRFGQPIADLASAILDYKLKIVGNENIESMVSDKNVIDESKPYTILFRGNMELIFTAVQYISEGKDVQVYVDLREFVKTITSAKELKAGNLKGVKAEKIIPFENWEELVEEGKTDPELSRLAKIIDGEDADRIVKQLKDHKNDNHAHITMLSAHKSKGLEWEQVILANDFVSNYDKKGRWVGLSEQERNLLYVAATRAERRLQYNATVGEILDHHNMQRELDNTSEFDSLLGAEAISNSQGGIEYEEGIVENLCEPCVDVNLHTKHFKDSALSAMFK